MASLLEYTVKRVVVIKFEFQYKRKIYGICLKCLRLGNSLTRKRTNVTYEDIWSIDRVFVNSYST